MPSSEYTTTNEPSVNPLEPVEQLLNWLLSTTIHLAIGLAIGLIAARAMRSRHLRRQQTDHDSELIHGDQPPAHAFRRDLRDVHRRKARGQAYRHAARYSPGEEPRERARHSGSNRTDGEQERRKDKQTFPSELVAEHAGSQRAE